MEIEIDSTNRIQAEELASKFVAPFFREFTDEQKMVFSVTLLREIGEEMQRVRKKFAP